jgi:hypothetical protein
VSHLLVFICKLETQEQSPFMPLGKKPELHNMFKHIYASLARVHLASCSLKLIAKLALGLFFQIEIQGKGRSKGNVTPALVKRIGE